MKDDYLDQMIGEAPGPINFTMFLTLFGERLTGTDPEEVIRNAFQCFDEDGRGMCVFFVIREGVGRYFFYAEKLTSNYYWLLNE